MKTLLNGLGGVSIGGFLGMIGVVMGAFGSHALEDRLTPDRLDAFQTAVKYQLFHALLLVAFGLAAVDVPRSMVWLFTLGVVLFSGSIYALVLLDASKLALLTPIGGTIMIVGWGWLVVWGYRVA